MSLPIRLPKLIFGATSLGNLFQQPSDEEKRAIIQAWIDSGSMPIVIDSAGKYGAGLSLEVIGRELKQLGVPPEQVLISNKLAWRRVPLTTPEPTFEPGVWIGLQHDAVQDISGPGIRRCWVEGNALLGDYRAGLLSVHDPDEYLAAAKSPAEREQRLGDIVDAYRELQQLKTEGQTLGVGIGAKDWRVIKELDTLCQFDWVMIANSFTILEHPPELVEFMSELGQRGVAVINSALFHGGFLLGGNYFNYRPVDASSAADARRLELRRRLETVCQQANVSLFDVGVAFGMSHPAVTSVALSSSRADRVASHFAAVERQIPDVLWRELRAAGVLEEAYPFLPH